MTPTPDKLFRDRLESLQTTPPPAAWDRIAIAVQPRKTHRKGIIIGAIAFIAVMCAGAFFILDQPAAPDQTPKQDTQEIHSPAMAKSPVNAKQPGANTVSTTPDAEIESTHHVNHTRKSTHIAATAAAIDVSQNPLMETSPVSVDSPDEIQNTIGFEETNTNAVADKAVENQTNKKITYTAADVNARFKRKSKPAAIDTSNKAPSALQRVLDVAYEFKYENTMLGDLRQMKDELFTPNGNGPARDK